MSITEGLARATEAVAKRYAGDLNYRSDQITQRGEFDPSIAIIISALFSLAFYMSFANLKDNKSEPTVPYTPNDGGIPPTTVEPDSSSDKPPSFSIGFNPTLN